MFKNVINNFPESHPILLHWSPHRHIPTLQGVGGGGTEDLKLKSTVSFSLHILVILIALFYSVDCCCEWEGDGSSISIALTSPYITIKGGNLKVNTEQSRVTFIFSLSRFRYVGSGGWTRVYCAAKYLVSRHNYVKYKSPICNLLRKSSGFDNLHIST